jgi:SAM-dependent methyltransferase
MSANGGAQVRAKSWSSPKTVERAVELLQGLDWKNARILDVGAGRGSFSQLLSRRLREEHGLDPREHIVPCDVIPESFEVEELECVRTPPEGKLPFPDASFDAAVSLEVIEHVENQLSFLREIARVVKPGGIVVVTTPNVLSMASRVRTLLWGFPELYGRSHSPIATRGAWAHPSDRALLLAHRPQEPGSRTPRCTTTASNDPGISSRCPPPSSRPASSSAPGCLARVPRSCARIGACSRPRRLEDADQPHRDPAARAGAA